MSPNDKNCQWLIVKSIPIVKNQNLGVFKGLSQVKLSNLKFILTLSKLGKQFGNYKIT